MCTPTLTLRTLKNVDTGIEISVPTVQEVEAPLGGTSVEYEVSVLTNLPSYKTQLHRSEDVVHFSVHKAYREIEDLYDKCSKKFRSVSLPQIPKGSSTLKCSTEEKRQALDTLMQFISRNKDLINAPAFAQFIGISQQRQLRSISNVSMKQEKIISESKAEFKKDHVFSNKTEHNDLTKDLETLDGSQTNSAHLENNNSSDKLFSDSDSIMILVDKGVHKTTDFPGIFQKMKVEKSSNQNIAKDDIIKKDPLFLPLIEEKGNSNMLLDDDVDLFEEVKHIKKVKNAETRGLDANKQTHQGLFDEFENRDSNLFESTLASKDNPSGSKKSSTVEVAPSKLVKDESEKQPKSKNITENTIGDDSKLILENRKLGDVSLFREQDLGDFITEDEEPLFLVTEKEKRDENKNPFLSPKEDKDEVLEQNDVNDFLEAIMGFSETPVALQKTDKPITSVPKEEKMVALPPKPVPKPRRKSLTSTVADPPQVMPRKVFLSKPSVPPKPVPPPKPKPAAKANKASIIAQKDINKLSKPESKKFVSSAVDGKQDNLNSTGDLNSLDILQYIEQEQKSSSAEASLFD